MRNADLACVVVVLYVARSKMLSTADKTVITVSLVGRALSGYLSQSCRITQVSITVPMHEFSNITIDVIWVARRVDTTEQWKSGKRSCRGHVSTKPLYIIIRASFTALVSRIDKQFYRNRRKEVVPVDAKRFTQTEDLHDFYSKDSIFNKDVFCS